jgi:hypothetical protein
MRPKNPRIITKPGKSVTLPEDRKTSIFATVPQVFKSPGMDFPPMLSSENIFFWPSP